MKNKKGEPLTVVRKNKENKNEAVEIDELYVASMVLDVENMVEPFIQYETFGRIDHYVIYTPKKRLIYTLKDENGNVKYYDYETNEEIEIYDKKSSYATQASVLGSVYHFSRDGRMHLPSLPMDDIRKMEKEKNQLRYSTLIPFNDYTKMKIGRTIKLRSVKSANRILKMIPTHKTFALNFGEEKAQRQIDKYIYCNKIDLIEETEKERDIIARIEVIDSHDARAKEKIEALKEQLLEERNNNNNKSK